MQAVQNLGFSSSQLQYCFYPSLILVLQPLSLGIDGTAWAAQLGAWGVQVGTAGHGEATVLHGCC